MSKQSYDHTDMIGMLRVANEVSLTAADMVGDFIDLVKRGYVGADGRLTDKGKQKLAEEDRAL